MNMTDETLSAFLDNELTPAEMEAVRDQLAADTAAAVQLADRLAELASVDSQLQAHYGAIDDRPLPTSVTRMLEDLPAQAGSSAHDNVITFPWWRRLRGHAGKAVAAAVIGGVALMQWSNLPSSGDPAWPAVAQVLDSQPSGEVYRVDNQSTLTPRLTFRNTADHWCRQFRLETGSTASEQIACRSDGGTWEQVTRVETDPLPESGQYQTASGGRVVDEALDRIMAGSPVGPDQERALLERQWRQ